MTTAAGGQVSAAAGLHLAMAALVLSAGMATWAAADPVSAVAQAKAVAMGGVGYVLCWALARRRGPRAGLLAATLGLGAMCGAYYIFQYRHFALPEAKIASLDAIGRALSGPWPRLGGWSPFANSLATLLEGLAAVAVGVALSRGAAVTRTLAAAAAAVIAAALLLSASRGAWLAVAVSLAALVAYRPVVRWPAAFAVAATAALFAVVAGTVAAGGPWWIRAAAAAGRPDRLDVFAQAAALLRDVPFTGVGPGDQFATAVSKHVLLIQVPFLTYAHNLGLQVWLELGLLGLAAWCALAAAVGVAAVAGERAGLGRRFRGLWAGVLAVHVHGLVDARQFVDPWTWLPFFLLVGVIAGHVSRGSCRVPRLAAALPVVAGAVVVVAALAGRGVPRAAWQVNLGAVDQGRADASAAAGDAAGAAGPRAAAVRRYSRALELAPDDGPALRRLGGMALEDGRYAEAARLLGRAWAAEPGHAASRKAYGLAAVWIGDTSLAASLLGAVPGMAAELSIWSRWRHDRGEADLALSAARTSLAIAPQQPEVAAWLRELEAGPRPAAEPPPR